MMTGVILAGGQNRRMGGKLKALLPIEGEALLLRQLKEMSPLCTQVLVVTNTPDVFSPLLAAVSSTMNVQCVPDRYVQKGPLSGLHAGCLDATESLLWVVGCDMPFLSADAAKAMGKLCQDENKDAVIPVINGRIHPLHGVYAQSVGQRAEALLAKEQYRLMGLLNHLEWVAVENDFFNKRQISTLFTTNINSPEQYDSIR
ncbi:molybdenum cofactor guanylyltransferase [Paenibacillus sp. N3.4]|uniref:molybdenum cofactor guanylyltransferase n=1 Tax=Paenibacillus sp. N3.4 TaxID=2603222 RepID=UPI0011CB18B2|nr:molybdenum cofactor guanylyltransferase [Paenibacillus sp. N3.4]TXK75120.1 molybdenum cofactor guanylyltransferase [Paenibacillus sp. N3.4]